MWFTLFDPLYIMLLAPCLILSLFATFYVKSTFHKFSEIGSRSRTTGAEAARILLLKNGITDVKVEQVQGFLSDHYDPINRVLRLSPSVYSSPSISAIGVACHEAGHAIQHAHGFFFLHLRTAMVPITGFSSNLSYILIMASFFLRAPGLMLAGAILFGVAVLFSLITLPVEWDASRRAKLAVSDIGILNRQEAAAASKVLNAAFLTYVASAVTALLTLIYYLIRSGVIGGKRG